MARLTNATSAIIGFLFSVVLMTSCSTAKDEKTVSAEETAQAVAETKVDNKAITPSFDCAKAKTEVEKLICSDPELARLDREMANSYVAFMETLDEDFYRKKLVRKQYDWLGYRGKLSCFNTNNKKKTDCLKKSYVRRIENLSNWKERNNYDFWADFFDYANNNSVLMPNDTRANWDKIISELGNEYYINCGSRYIYPSLPEEKIAFYRSGGYDLWPHIPKDTLGFRLRSKREGDTLYLICDRYPIKNYKKYYESKKKEITDQKAFILKEYPLKKEDTMMIRLLKEYIFDNTVFVTSLQDLREVDVLGAKKFKGDKQCTEVKENIKNNFYKIKRLNFITSKSIKELLSKINIPCSEKELREQFDNLKYYKNGNDGENVFFSPIYGQYVYAKDKERLSIIGGTRDILFFPGVFLFEMNEKKCELSSDNIKDAKFIPNESFNFYINDQEYVVSSKNKRILSLTIKEKKEGTKIYQNNKDCVLIKEEKEQKNEQ